MSIDRICKSTYLHKPHNYRHTDKGCDWIVTGLWIYVRDYADAKIGCVPVACHLLCSYMPRELPGRGTKGAGIPRDLPGRLSLPLPPLSFAFYHLSYHSLPSTSPFPTPKPSHEQSLVLWWQILGCETETPRIFRAA